MLPLLGSLDCAFEQLDLSFCFPRRIALYLFVHLPDARHHIGLNAGRNIRKQLRCWSAKKNETGDHQFEGRWTLLLFDSRDDFRAASIPGDLRVPLVRDPNAGGMNVNSLWVFLSSWCVFANHKVLGNTRHDVRDASHFGRGEELPNWQRFALRQSQAATEERAVDAGLKNGDKGTWGDCSLGQSSHVIRRSDLLVMDMGVGKGMSGKRPHVPISPIIPPAARHRLRSPRSVRTSSSIFDRSPMGTTYTPWLLYVPILRRFRRMLPIQRFVIGLSYSNPYRSINICDDVGHGNYWPL